MRDTLIIAILVLVITLGLSYFVGASPAEFSILFLVQYYGAMNLIRKGQKGG